jgi:translation initiation factor 3 subunit E
VAVLLSPRRKNMLRDLLNEIQNMAYLYSDPILAFIVTLYDTFNIDETQLRLKEALVLMKNDFFLCVHLPKFADLAKMLMCEMYCSMYSRVDLDVLADKLELTTDEAEKWMVSMVKNTASSGSSNGGSESNAPVSTTLNSVANDARIDSAAKHVILAPPTYNIYQQVADKTRDLTARSAMLNTNMNTLLSEQGILIKNREA